VFSHPLLYDVLSRVELFGNYRRISGLVVKAVPSDARNVLDMGAGGGYLTCRLADRGFDVVALDAGEAAISRNRQRCSERVVLARALHAPFPDGVFDAVVSSFAFHHFTSTAGVLSECRRLLADGGVFTLVDILKPGGFRRAITWPVLQVEGSPLLYDEPEWRRLAVGAGFIVEEFRRLHLGTLFLAKMRAVS